MMRSLKLSLGKPFKSITSLPAVELPALSVLTGLNGSGKTHLLQAIQAGNVLVEGISKSRARLIDPATMAPSADPSISAARWLEIDGNSAALSSAVEATIQDLKKLIVRKRALPGSDDPQSWKDLEARAVGNTLAAQSLATIKSLTGANLQKFLRGLPLAAVEFDQKAAERYAADPSDETLQAFWDNLKLKEGSHQLSAIFNEYKQRWIANAFVRYAREEGRQTEKSHLSSDKFTKLYGPPPWDVLNDSYARLNLPYRLEQPDLSQATNITAVLKDTRSGLSVPFADLSSGERVISYLGLWRFGYDLTAPSGRKISRGTDLFLLDEVDAHLHPAQVKMLMSFVHSYLVEQLGASIIMTTHSPTTVALAPRDAIHVIDRETHFINRVSTQRAIESLSEGVPLLAVRFEDRRQVFVESVDDAPLYQRVYESLKPTLESERSLTFVGAGLRTKIGDLGAGCSVVESVVGSLAAGGNSSVFGLIDYDGGKRSAGRIVVMSEGGRYTLENLLLDPLLVGALLIHQDRYKTVNNLGLSPDLSYAALASASQTVLQELSSAVQKAILGKVTNPTNLIECEYGGDFKLGVDASLLQRDGKLLRENVVEAFPSLKAFAGKGQLLTKMVDPILVDIPKLTPKDFSVAFKRLLNLSLE
jgi:hypothetical protein